MYKLRATKQFKKDLKRVNKRGKALEKIEAIINNIRKGIILDEKYLDHALSGNMKGCRDCHIEPDWLLLYKIESETLVLLRTGSHSDLFD